MAGDGVREQREMSQKCRVAAGGFQMRKNCLGDSELAVTTGIQAEAGGPLGRGLAQAGT